MYVHGHIKIIFVVFHAFCETIKTNVWKRVFVHNLSTFYPQCAHIYVLTCVYIRTYWIDKYYINRLWSAEMPYWLVNNVLTAGVFASESVRLEVSGFYYVDDSGVV